MKVALHSLHSVGVVNTPDCTPHSGLHSVDANLSGSAGVANLAEVANNGVDSRLECGVECEVGFCTPIHNFVQSAVWSASICTPKFLECINPHYKNFGVPKIYEI